MILLVEFSCAARSEFVRGAGQCGARRCQTARAWPRAAQQNFSFYLSVDFYFSCHLLA